MNMTPRNIAILVIAGVLGVFLGLRYPMLSILLLIPVIGYVVFVLVRNKSGALAGPEATADALRMIPAPGQARLYVVRKGFVGGQQGMIIDVDGRLHSQIRSKYFLMADLEPGQHSVRAKMASGTDSAARTHEFAAEAGDIIVLDMKLDMGMMQGAPNFTELRNRSEASTRLEGCRLVGWKTEERPSPRT